MAELLGEGQGRGASVSIGLSGLVVAGEGQRAAPPVNRGPAAGLGIGEVCDRVGSAWRALGGAAAEVVEPEDRRPWPAR